MKLPSSSQPDKTQLFLPSALINPSAITNVVGRRGRLVTGFQLRVNENL